MATQTYKITGMHCQNCANTIERMVGRAPGVQKCSVSFATESMTVELADAKPDEIARLVADLGYQAVPADFKKKP